jgi:hypothetical protein
MTRTGPRNRTTNRTGQRNSSRTRPGPRNRTTNRTGTRPSAGTPPGAGRHLGVPVPPQLLSGSPGNEALVWVDSGLQAFRHRRVGWRRWFSYTTGTRPACAELGGRLDGCVPGLLPAGRAAGAITVKPLPRDAPNSRKELVKKEPTGRPGVEQ